jgi:hypothetical protein
VHVSPISLASTLARGSKLRLFVGAPVGSNPPLPPTLPSSALGRNFSGFLAGRTGEAHGGTKRTGAKRDIRRKICTGRATRTVTELAVHYSRDTFQRRVTLSATERAIKIIRQASHRATDHYSIIRGYVKKEKGEKKENKKARRRRARSSRPAATPEGYE